MIKIPPVFVVLLGIFTYFLAMPSTASAKDVDLKPTGCNIKDTKQEINELKKEYVSKICTSKGSVIALKYSRKTNIIFIGINNQNFRLHQIPRGYEPQAVGAEEYISFLPYNLQPYLQKDIILYTTALRTTGGNGSGQCGSGAEISLHALDISEKIPKIISTFLISSCAEPIELITEGSRRETTDGLSIKDGKLAIEFLYYERRNLPIAILSEDLKRLEFVEK